MKRKTKELPAAEGLTFEMRNTYEHNTRRFSFGDAKRMASLLILSRGIPHFANLSCPHSSLVSALRQLPSTEIRRTKFKRSNITQPVLLLNESKVKISWPVFFRVFQCSLFIRLYNIEAVAYQWRQYFESKVAIESLNYWNTRKSINHFRLFQRLIS